MKYDAIMIGFGKANKTLAYELAVQGKSVAMIEKSPRMYGGTCINVGCIPSKYLILEAAKAAQYSKEDFKTRKVHYQKAIEEKEHITQMLRKKNYDKLNVFPNMTIYDGTGSFLSPTEVEVTLEDGVKVTLESEKIFINTGALPILPDIPGIENNSAVYTSETLMSLSQLPQRLTIVGAGYIGMEFASMYASYGSKVTVLQDGTTFLPREDRDVADEIRSILEKRGVKFVFGAKILRFEAGNVIYDKDGIQQKSEGEGILVATGRRPNTQTLNLEKANVRLTQRGAVQVDEFLRTTQTGIWAMGDVNGGPQFTFVSLDDFRIVSSQLHGKSRSRTQRENVPYSVFMAVPLGRVGVTEEEARRQNLPIRVLKLATAAVPKAQVLHETEGFLKVIIHAETGKILGAALLCPEAYEMINTIKLAMDMGVEYTVLRDQIYTHPTMTEAFNDLFAL